MKPRYLLSLLLAFCLLLPAFGQDKKLLLGSGGPTAAAGPFYVDTFTVPSDVSIFSHTSDSGHGYTRHFGAAYSAGDITVDGTLDRIWPSGTGAIFVWPNATPPSADYSFTADFRMVTNTGNAAIYLRVETSSGNGEDAYQLRAEPTSGQWQMRRIDNGAGTGFGSGSPAGTSTTNFPTAGGAAVTVIFSVTGSSFTVTAGGTQIITGSDSTYTAAGKPGFRFSGPFSASTGWHFDNMSAQ